MEGANAGRLLAWPLTRQTEVGATTISACGWLQSQRQPVAASGSQWEPAGTGPSMPPRACESRLVCFPGQHTHHLSIQIGGARAGECVKKNKKSDPSKAEMDSVLAALAVHSSTQQQHKRAA